MEPEAIATCDDGEVSPPHVMAFHRSFPVSRGDPVFWGTCSCGWKSMTVTTAGLVHGAFAVHRDKAEAHDEEDRRRRHHGE